VTQVKDKTDQQLNRALAELMGYTVKPSTQSGVFSLMMGGKIKATSNAPEELIWSYAPDYCTDPAASLEVQAKAIEVDAELYVRYLNLLFCSDHVWDALYPDQISKLLNASHRERAEAAYITLQGARDDNS
jgi:hypothetical protein